MKIILYSNNLFQSLLCLDTVREFIESDERLSHQIVFNGLISLKRNNRSITSTYLNAKDTIIDFSLPVKEEDKTQLKLEL